MSLAGHCAQPATVCVSAGTALEPARADEDAAREGSVVGEGRFAAAVLARTVPGERGVAGRVAQFGLSDGPGPAACGSPRTISGAAALQVSAASSRARDIGGEPGRDHQVIQVGQLGGQPAERIGGQLLGHEDPAVRVPAAEHRVVMRAVEAAGAPLDRTRAGRPARSARPDPDRLSRVDRSLQRAALEHPLVRKPDTVLGTPPGPCAAGDRRSTGRRRRRRPARN